LQAPGGLDLILKNALESVFSEDRNLAMDNYIGANNIYLPVTTIFPCTWQVKKYVYQM